MAIFSGASAGAVIRLRCPKCAEIQARARKPKGVTYTCRKCAHVFTRGDAMPPSHEGE